MDEAAFRVHLKENGYEDMGVKEMAADHAEATHTHDFDAAILVLAGEISAVMADRTVTCRAGDSFSLDANTPHSEQVGADGVRFLVGRR